MKKTKNIKKSVKSQEVENLYISLVDVNTKRKSLLSSIKDSLIMQEEYEKVKSFRKSKGEILNDIKKNIKNINLDYQQLKKIFPNIKNVLSYTENELPYLEGQVSKLKSNISYDKKETLKVETLIENLNSDIPIKITSNKLKKNVSKQLSKLDRIKNNLKVIEAKLSEI